MLASEFLADQELVDRIDDQDQSDEKIVAEIKAHVARWKQAWESRDMDGYFAAYSSNFIPSNDMSIQSWKHSREQAIMKPDWIRLELENLDVRVDGVAASVQFIQRYDASDFQDVVNKKLEMRLEEGAWVITTETVR